MRGTTLMIMVGAALVVAPGIALAQDGDNACTELTYTGHPDYAPMAFRDGDAIAGAGARVVEEAAAALGITTHSVFFGPWQETQEAARNGETDIIFSLYVTDDRLTYLDFVEPPFALNPEVALVPAGAAFDFDGPENLIGKRGITVAGESFGNELDAFIIDNLDVARVDRLADAINGLLAGDADYLIFGLYPALSEAADLGVADELEALSPPLLEGNLHIAFSKQSTCLDLIDDFGAEVQALIDSGRVEDLIEDAEATWAEAIAP